MGRAVKHVRGTGQDIPALLPHVAPLGWRYIVLTGDFLWEYVDRAADDYRALTLPRASCYRAA